MTYCIVSCSPAIIIIVTTVSTQQPSSQPCYFVVLLQDSHLRLRVKYEVKIPDPKPNLLIDVFVLPFRPASLQLPPFNDVCSEIPLHLLMLRIDVTIRGVELLARTRRLLCYCYPCWCCCCRLHAACVGCCCCCRCCLSRLFCNPIAPKFQHSSDAARSCCAC